MNFRFGKGIGLYLSFVLICSITIVSYATYYFWKSGLTNGQFIGEVYEVSNIHTRIEKDNNNKRLFNNVNYGNITEALDTINYKEKQVDKINRIVPLVSEYKQLKIENKKVASILGHLITFPEPEKLINVFSNKIYSFENFVKKNQWRTLIRMSARIKSKLRKAKRIEYAGLQRLQRSITQDISIMRNVTETSILSRQDKSIILHRLGNLSLELNMLDKFLKKAKDFFKIYKSYSVSYNSWLSRTGAKLSLIKIDLEDKGQKMIFAMSTFIVALICFLFAGFFITKKSMQTWNEKVEKEGLKIIQNKLLNQNEYEVRGSKEFSLELDKLSKYTQKRMMLGSYFQASLPFSSVLIDEHLKVIWGNELFCNQWLVKQHDITQNALSWDYLIRFTNIEGDDDPIKHGFKDNIAGIYQIQIRLDQNGEKIPYEMYVRPINVNNMRKVMLFFYPLSSLQETISDQAFCLVSPIESSLDALVNQKFDKGFKNKIEDKFGVGGIERIFKKFCKLNEVWSLQKNGLLNEIDQLERSNEILQGKIKRIDIANTDGIKNGVSLNHNLKLLRDNIISNIKQYHKLSKLYSQSSNVMSEILQETVTLDKSGKEIVGKMIENHGSIKKINVAKGNFNELKEMISSAKIKLSQTIDQAVIFQKTNEFTPLHLESALIKIKTDAKLFDRTIQQFDKAFTYLDVTLAKIMMVLEEGKNASDTKNALNVEKKITRFISDGRVHSERYKDLIAEFKIQEDKIVTMFNQLHGSVKGTVDLNKKIMTVTKNLEDSKQVRNENSTSQLSV